MPYIAAVSPPDRDGCPCAAGDRSATGVWVSKGRELFRSFHRFPPDRLIRAGCRRPPPVLVRLGSLKGVIYVSDRGRPRRERTYIHFMEDPPVLACDPEGRQLYVLGGRYRVTDRGIEG